MTLDEAMDSKTWVSKREAQREIAKHGASWSDFVRDLSEAGKHRGEGEVYRARDVLGWLGY